MAWTLEQQSNNTNDEIWKKRIQMSFLKVAFDITNESDSVENHAQRLLLAQQVISGNGMPVRAPSILHILNPGIQVDNFNASNNPTDNDILFTVAQQWNYFAPKAEPVVS